MLNDNELMVLSTIRGRESIYSAEIERQLAISGSVLRDIVKSLRRAGYPIVGGNSGYFLAKTRKQYEALLDDLQGRANSLAHTVRKLRDVNDKKFEGVLF